MAGTGGVLAAFFVFRGDYEKVFVAAAAGAVCWFLNYRQQLRETIAQQEEKDDEQEDPDEELPS